VKISIDAKNIKVKEEGYSNDKMPCLIFKNRINNKTRTSNPLWKNFSSLYPNRAKWDWASWHRLMPKSGLDIAITDLLNKGFVRVYCRFSTRKDTLLSNIGELFVEIAVH
jgi:hypothetical protein